MNTVQIAVRLDPSWASPKKYSNKTLMFFDIPVLVPKSKVAFLKKNRLNKHYRGFAHRALFFPEFLKFLARSYLRCFRYRGT